MVLLTLATGLALTLGWWVDRAVPVPLPEAAARLPCLSYAPFRAAGQTPFDPAAHVPPQRIEEDLRLLRPLSGCIRTYAVDQGLDAVPEVARRLGLRVKLGAWIGRDSAANDAQLQRALALARDYADVVELLIVGSEVLLRRELEPAALAALLARARREASVPVSYADVWEFWLRHAAAIEPHVDIVTVHILPYWEDEPVAVEQAVGHVYSIAERVRQRFVGKPVLVGETGWPAAGRQRAGAVPGRLQQARFVRELAARAEREPLDFNVIEAFDQPWKRALEGAMGGAWGLFDSHGAAHFPWRGPLEQDPAAWPTVGATALGGVVGLLVAAVRWRSALAALAGGLAAALIVALGVAQWQAMLTWNRTPFEWIVSSLAWLAALTGSLLACNAIALRLAGSDLRSTPGIASALRGSPGAAVRALACARAVLLFIACVLALQLVFDGRYREFAWPLLAAPALLLLALRLAGDAPAADANEERWLAALAVLCAAALIAGEGLRNLQAIVFAVLLLMLGFACGWPQRAAGRANTSSASSAAGAASPAE